jgi:hypothetical protein
MGQRFFCSEAVEVMDSEKVKAIVKFNRDFRRQDHGTRGTRRTYDPWCAFQEGDDKIFWEREMARHGGYVDEREVTMR